MPAVTIVVPCYKVEKYIEACFESLLKQTNNDFVIMAVNDGSPDNCLEIMNRYAEQYPEKIIVIDKPNGGYGSVLQRAIQEMTTPYFLVCDPDDTLEEDAIEVLLNTAQVSGADITVGAKYVITEGDSEKVYNASYNTDFVTLKPLTVYNKGTEEFNDLFFINPSPHAKLYKRDVAKNIQFTEKVGYTDNMLFYLSLLNSEKVVYTDRPLAVYLIDRAGNTMTDVSVKAMKGQIKVFNEIVDQAEELSNIPDIYWYRMFESYKFMLYESRRVNGTQEEYSEVLDDLGIFVAKIAQHGDATKKFYKKYAKTKFLEKRRDLQLMDRKTVNAAYSSVKSKMMKEK